MAVLKLAGQMPPIVYKLMIVTSTLIWGSTFVVMKDAVDVMPPSWLIGIRFLLTAVILTAIFFKRFKAALSRQTVIAGCVLGLFDFSAYWFQTVGLVYTTPGKNAFLTATYCVLVPFIFWIVTRRRPTLFNIAAAFICIAGVGFVSLSNDTLSIGFGDAMTLVCGLLFAMHIVATSVFSKKRDVMVLTIFQFIASGTFGIIVGILTEPFPAFGAITPDFVFNLLYLVIFGSCIAMGFQNAALAHVLPSQAAILLSLESVFGVVFSVILYGEQMTLPLVTGFVLIFASIILSEAFPRKRPPEAVDEAIAEDAAAIE